MLVLTKTLKQVPQCDTSNDIKFVQLLIQMAVSECYIGRDNPKNGCPKTRALKSQENINEMASI